MAGVRPPGEGAGGPCAWTSRLPGVSGHPQSFQAGILGIPQFTLWGAAWKEAPSRVWAGMFGSCRQLTE